MSRSEESMPWTYLRLQKRAQQLLGIDLSSQPAWYVETLYCASVLVDLSRDSNASMTHADIYGDAEQRYRNCMSVGCGKSFKFQHADDWTCPDCKAQRAELIRRDRVNEGLFNANGKVNA